MPSLFSFDILPDGSLVLTLDESCISTTARRAHRELTAALLQGIEIGTSMEALVDLLQRFLSENDFPALRASHPELTGHNGCRVRLYRRKGGEVRWELLSS